MFSIAIGIGWFRAMLVRYIGWGVTCDYSVVRWIYKLLRVIVTELMEDAAKTFCSLSGWKSICRAFRTLVNKHVTHALIPPSTFPKMGVVAEIAENNHRDIKNICTYHLQYPRDIASVVVSFLIIFYLTSRLSLLKLVTIWLLLSRT